jgi:hypothetical protein
MLLRCQLAQNFGLKARDVREDFCGWEEPSHKNPLKKATLAAR